MRHKKILTRCLWFASISCIFVIGANKLLSRSTNPAIVEAHPSSTVTINVGTANEQQIPVDSTNLVEKELVDQNGYKNYVQNPSSTLSLTKNKTIGESTIVGDVVLDSRVLSNGKVMLLLSHSNYNWVSGNPREITTAEVLLCSADGTPEKRIPVNGIYPDWVNSVADKSYTAGINLIYSNGDGTYTIPYNSLDGSSQKKILIVNETLTSVVRQNMDWGSYGTENHSFNRNNEDYTGQIYLFSFMDKNATQKSNFKIYPLNKNGTVEAPGVIKSMYNHVGYTTLMGSQPSDWFEGLTAMVRGPNEEYVGISTFANHSVSIGIKNMVVIWDKHGTPLYIHYLNDKKNSSGIYQKEISDVNNYFLTENCDTTVKLQKIDVASRSLQTVQEFPAGTTIRFSRNSDGTYQFYGYIKNFTGIFSGYGSTASAVVGIMDSNFTIKTLNSIATTSTIDIKKMLHLSDDNYFISGSTTGQDFYNQLNGVWQQKQTPHNDTKNLLYGTLKSRLDYAPAINKSVESIAVDLDDPTLTSDVKDSNQLTALDRWLITGEKNGTYSSPTSIKVHDQFDLNYSLSGHNQTWLNQRINRNKEDPDLAIDWQALGFDRTNAGPQRVTYFISDSQKQVTSTSRWINAEDKQTVTDTKGYLRAENFSISYQDIANHTIATQNDLKKLAQTQAWLSEPTSMTAPYIENSKAATPTYSSHVSFNETQLATLQAAKSSEQAYPYPLDITYEDSANSVKVSRRIWVFVTTKNTKVDTENDIVIYANDYTRIFHHAPSETAQKAYTSSDINVYDYATLYTESDQLPPLADKSTTTGLTADITSIINVTQPGTIAHPLFTYKNTSTSVAVTFKEAEAAITIKFVDEDNADIHPAISLTDKVNTKKDITAAAEVRTTIDTLLKDQLYEVKTRPPNEKAVLIPENGTEVTYIFEGFIGLKKVTDLLSFQTGSTSSNKQELSYESTEDFVLKITDNRAQNNAADGQKRGQFTIQARLSKEFTKANQPSKNLTGAKLIYNDGKTDTEIFSGGNQIYSSSTSNVSRDYILKLDKNSGDKILEKKEGFRLIVPAGVAEKGKYLAEITWDLVQGP